MIFVDSNFRWITLDSAVIARKKLGFVIASLAAFGFNFEMKLVKPTFN